MADVLKRFHRTGRTTRAVAKAIELAVKGKYVIYVCAHACDISHIHGAIFGQATELGVKFSKANLNKVYLGDGPGSITIHQSGLAPFNPHTLNYETAHPDCEVIVDPAVVERYHKKALYVYHLFDEAEAPAKSQDASATWAMSGPKRGQCFMGQGRITLRDGEP